MHTTTPSPACRMAPGVYLTRQDDIVRIFDLERGRFYGLDSIASRMLELTCTHGPDHAATEIAAAFGVGPSEVRADIDTLIAGLHRRGLLEHGEAGPVRRWLPGWLAGPCRVSGPATLRVAARLLRRAWWSLRLDGWASTLQRWRRPAGKTQTLAPGDADAVIAQVDLAVRDAAAGLLVFPVACKEKALVGHHLLRAVYGLPATLVVGVQHYPFIAHAWVEIAGRVVTDDAAHCAGFEPVARFE